MLLGQVLVFVTLGLGLAVVATCFTLKQRTRTSSEWVRCRAYVETAVQPKSYREPGDR